MSRQRFNPKRRLLPPGAKSAAELEALAERAGYGGNPEHKQTPGDFGLTPPSDPRPDKTWCDTAGVFEVAAAEALLGSGLRRGFVSQRWPGEWPQNVWCVREDGVAFEAQLENLARGTYHGYPMPLDDPFRIVIVKAWSQT